MLNLIQAEIYKLSKSTAFRICFLLSMISAVSLIVISHFIVVGKLSESISGNASGLTEVCIISLLGSLMAGIIVSSDYDTKTIHSSIANGNGRRMVVISKVVIYVIMMALLLLPYALVTIVAVCTGAEFTKPFVPSMFIRILYDSAGVKVTFNMISKIICISLVTVLVHAARLSLCVLLAFKIRKSVAILAFGFVFNGLIDLFVRLLKDIPVIPSLVKLTPYSPDFMMVNIQSKAGILIKATISSVVFLVIIGELTYQIFKKAEIK